MPSPELTVPYGQVTFDAEGNDDSNSIYFSRVVHWPGGVSGVTIGRGYDFGHRGDASVIASEFSKANINLGPYQSAIGLQGTSAQNWVKANKGSLAPITHQQQKDLFAFVYESIKKDVIRLSTKADVVRAYGSTNFDTLHPGILDIVVDLRYRGDYTPSSRKRVQPCMVNNDFEGFRTLMSDRNFWSNVPADRFKRRVQHLNNLAAGGNSGGNESTAPVTPEPEIEKPQTHVVQPGESLSKLSRRFDVSIDALKTANASKLKRWGNVEGFNAGETITIP